MTKIDTSSEFINADYVLKSGVTEIIPLDEGVYEESNFKKGEMRLVFQKVQCNDREKSIKKWSPNKQSLKNIEQMYGDDTKNVIGKRLRVVVMPTNSGKNGVFVVLENIQKPETLPIINQTQEHAVNTSAITTPE
jgi:hypothetical protein